MFVPSHLIIKDIKNKGKALFANEDIKRQRIILPLRGEIRNGTSASPEAV